MPRLKHYWKKGEPWPLEQAVKETDRQSILKTVRSIEMHLAVSCVVIGILQSLSVNSAGVMSSSRLRYQRTPARRRVSEAALMHHLRKYFFPFTEKEQKLRITQKIQEQQDRSGIYWDSLAY